MKIEEFTQMLKDRPAPTQKQMENLEKIKKISKRFHRETGIDEDVCDVELDEHTIVLESGHQPNFIPSLGVIKKAFLLDFFAEKAKSLGRKPVPIFQFSDYNVCTAKLMYQNKIPAINTKGFEKIGFKFSNENTQKRLNEIEKPTELEWEHMLKKLEQIYSAYAKSGIERLDTNLRDFVSVMNESYSRAKNFADMNEFIIARLSHDVFRLDVILLRLSDLQRERVLLEESMGVISNFREFQSISSADISKNAVIPRDYTANIIPFWYQCKCGANVELYLTPESRVQGTCKLCGKDVELDSASLPAALSKMNPDAISRNIIYSEGLGTALFIAGSGGSLKYGITSNAISRKIGFNTPLTIAWKSRDEYIGAAHLTVLYLMMKMFKLKIEDFLDARILSDKIRASLSHAEGTKMELALKNQLSATSNIFKLNYSMADLFAFFGLTGDITKLWQIDKLRITKFDEFYILEGDVIYNKPTRWVNLSEEQISKIYNNLNYIKDKVKI